MLSGLENLRPISHDISPEDRTSSSTLSCASRLLPLTFKLQVIDRFSFPDLGVPQLLIMAIGSHITSPTDLTAERLLGILASQAGQYLLPIKYLKIAHTDCFAGRWQKGR